MGLKKIGKNILRTVNKAGSDIKHQAVRSGHDVGGALDSKWTKLGLAAALAATGVGAPAAAAIMAAEGAAGGALKNGGGLHDAAVGGVKGAAAGYTAGTVGEGLTALKSGAGVGNALKTGMGFGGGGEMGLEGGNIAGENVGRFRKVGGFLKDNARTITDFGRLGEGVYDRYQQNQDRKRADEEYAANKPLRDAGMAGLLDTSKPDFSSVFADPMAPKGRYRSMNVGSRGTY